MFDIIVRYGDGAVERIRGFKSRREAEREIKLMWHAGSEILSAYIEEYVD